MRKKFYLYACFGILAVLAIYACTKELDGRDSKGEAGQAGELTVIEAQAYFQDLAADFTLAALKNPQTRSTGEMVVTPLWNESRTFRIGTTPMVEVPLNVLPGYTCIRKDTMDVAAMNGHAPNTMTYLLAQKDDDGDIGYRVASIVADSAYLAGDPDKTLENLSVSKLSDFSGKIFYYDVSGELLDGVVYRDGREVAVIRPTGSAPPQDATSGTSGQTRANADGGYYCELWASWDERCWAGIGLDEIYITCVISNVHHFLVCYPMGGGGGDTGGNTGGNTGGGTPPPTTPTDTTTVKYAKPNLPKTIKPQENKNYCVPAIMEFLRNFFGLAPFTQTQIVRDYYERYLVGTPRMFLPFVEINGWPTGDVIPYLELDFTTITTNMTALQALNKGYFIITDIATGIPNRTHNILIIGYRGNQFIYYDPADGTQKYISPSQIPANYIRAIIGKK